MIEAVPFRAHHLPAIKAQSEQLVEIGEHQTYAYGDYLETQGPAWTAIRCASGHQADGVGCASGQQADGDRADRVIAAIGLIEHSGPHCSAWGLVSEDIGAGEMKWLTGAIQRVLAVGQYARIDTMVRADFPRARRWALHLGFELEGVMRQWGAQSIDMALYARIRKAGG